MRVRVTLYMCARAQNVILGRGRYTMDEVQVCVELDRVLVELMDCLGQLAVLRQRLSAAVSEVNTHTHRARTYTRMYTHVHARMLAGIFQHGEGALCNGS